MSEDKTQADAEQMDVAADTPPVEEKPAKKSTAARKSAPKEDDLSSGSVDVKDLRINTRNSDSVKRLQSRLGLNVTGNYDANTMLGVRVWQNKNGFAGGRGQVVSQAQAERLFGARYDVQADSGPSSTKQ
jgi:hypothetical protein